MVKWYFFRNFIGVNIINKKMQSPRTNAILAKIFE